MFSGPVSYETFLIHLCFDNLQEQWLVSKSIFESSSVANDLLTKQLTSTWHHSQGQHRVVCVLWSPSFGPVNLWTLQNGPDFILFTQVMFYP